MEMGSTTCDNTTRNILFYKL